MGTSVINPRNGLCFFGFLVFLDNVFYKISVDLHLDRYSCILPDICTDYWSTWLVDILE